MSLNPGHARTMPELALQSSEKGAIQTLPPASSVVVNSPLCSETAQKPSDHSGSR